MTDNYSIPGPCEATWESLKKYQVPEWYLDAKMGPKRDIVGELADATRKYGLVFAASSHRAEHWWFFDGGRKFPSDVQDPANDGLYGPAATASPDVKHSDAEWQSRDWKLRPD